MDRWRQRFGVLAILVSVLSGKIGLPVGWLGLDSAPLWADVRFGALLAAGVLLIPEIRRVRFHDLLKPVFVSVFILCAYLFVRSWWDVSDATLEKRVDFVVIVVQMILCAAAIMSAETRRDIAVQILVLASSYLMIAIGGQLFEFMGKANNFGLGWGPIGGPITFNRVQFLAFCVAMCLVVGPPARKVTLASLAAVFLFAALASLQKAAILAAFLALGFAGLWLLARLEWKRVAILIIVSVVAVASMLMIYGERLSGRLERLTETASAPTAQSMELAFTPEPAQINLPEIPLDAPPAHELQNGSEPPAIQFPAFPPQPVTTFSVEALGGLVRYCLYEGPQIEGQPIPALTCPAAMFSDRSSRFTFWAEAMRGWIERPAFGHGIASYEITVPAPYSLLPDTYRYPHNLPLEVAFEGGGVGALLLAFALIMALRAPFRSSASLQTRAYSATFMVFMLIGTMFSGDFYDSRLFWLGAIALAFWKAAEGQGVEWTRATRP